MLNVCLDNPDIILSLYNKELVQIPHNHYNLNLAVDVQKLFIKQCAKITFWAYFDDVLTILQLKPCLNWCYSEHFEDTYRPNFSRGTPCSCVWVEILSRFLAISVQRTIFSVLKVHHRPEVSKFPSFWVIRWIRVGVSCWSCWRDTKLYTREF